MEPKKITKTPSDFRDHKIALGMPYGHLDLKSLNSASLVTVVESKAHPKAERLAAGKLLATRGDPRISTTEPCMVDIPGGHIVIGLHCEEVREIAQQTQPFGVLKESIEIEAPQLRVKIAPFRMGKYCVTNQEFYSFIKQVGSQHLPTSWQEDIFDPEKANHPVFSVSFSAANEYCLWLSEKTKRNFRLPKEAEWEYVAGGTERFKFPWGNTFQQDHANTIEEQILSTTPIGMFAQGHSPFGVLDMAGNVEEYTMDRLYSYNGKLLDDKNCIKPLEGCRVIRGGSFARFHNLARTTSRHADYQSDKYVIGFRLVEEFSIH